MSISWCQLPSLALSPARDAAAAAAAAADGVDDDAVMTLISVLCAGRVRRILV